jgi:hypothetical protein
VCAGVGDRLRDRALQLGGQPRDLRPDSDEQAVTDLQRFL